MATCFKCSVTIPQIDSIMDMMRIPNAMVHNQAGCSKCGVVVCFNCAAAAGDAKGHRGHCYCPKCGADLGRGGETSQRLGGD